MKDVRKLLQTVLTSKKKYSADNSNKKTSGGKYGGKNCAPVVSDISS